MTKKISYTKGKIMEDTYVYVSVKLYLKPGADIQEVVQECDYKSPELNDTILEFVEDLKIDGLILTPPLSDMDDFLQDLDMRKV